MKTVVSKEALIKRYDWSIIGLIITFTLFGIVSFAGQRILSTMVLQNKMNMNTYQTTLFQFNLVVGIASSLALIVFFVSAAIRSLGSIRVAFIIGMISSISPFFSAIATKLLFEIIGLSPMGVGSVIATVLSSTLLVLPTLIMFIIFACNKKLRLSSRILALVIGILSFIMVFFPVIVSVLALVVMPNNPAMGPLMRISGYLKHVSPLLIALGIAVLYFMNRINVEE